MKDKIINFCKNDNFPFIVLFLVYSLLFFKVKIVGDDAVLMSTYANLSFNDIISLALDDYYNWSSRVIVNTVIHIVLGKDKLIWIFLNSFVVVVFAKSISVLFVGDKNKKIVNYLIGAFILLYPISHLGSAGWLITYMTYFWPVTFGFVSLIPIKKIIDGDEMSKKEIIFYSFSLIYASNEELEIVFLLAIYIVFVFFFVITKKNKLKVLYLELFLLFTSLIFTFTCPGNGTRNGSEIANWFPNYNMLTIFDKIDLGMSNILNEILYNNYIVVCFFCILLSLIICIKYKSGLYKFVSLVPSFIVIVFGPIKKLTYLFFPNLRFLTESLTFQGVFTPFNCGFKALIAFTLPCIVVLCIVICLILAFEKIENKIISITMLIASFASSSAMGFSPTVFASGFRTATVLFCTFIILCIMVLDEICEKEYLNKKRIYCLSSFFGLISFLNLLYDFTIVIL